MIVVTNTSPLTSLAAIGQFDLLHRLYARLHIAHGVWDELNAEGERWPGCDEVAKADWIEQHAVQNRALVTALQRDLDRGEAETIALALELDADLVLLDEREGRHAAQRLGLRTVGVVGVLLEAKASGAIDAVHPHLDALRQSTEKVKGTKTQRGLCASREPSFSDLFPERDGRGNARLARPLPAPSVRPHHRYM